MSCFKLRYLHLLRILQSFTVWWLFFRLFPLFSSNRNSSPSVNANKHTTTQVWKELKMEEKASQFFPQCHFKAKVEGGEKLNRTIKASLNFPESQAHTWLEHQSFFPGYTAVHNHLSMNRKNGIVTNTNKVATFYMILSPFYIISCNNRSFMIGEMQYKSISLNREVA